MPSTAQSPPVRRPAPCYGSRLAPAFSAGEVEREAERFGTIARGRRALAG